MKNPFDFYREGRLAYEHGAPRDSAPYVNPDSNSAFQKGWDAGKHATENGLVHVAGGACERVQHCVICGCVLTDNRGGEYAIIADRPPPTDSYWPEGPVTVVKNGCRTDFTAGALPRVPTCTYEIGGL